MRSPIFFKRCCVAAIAVLFPVLGANGANEAPVAPSALAAQQATGKAALPTMAPGFRVSVYAAVREPMKLSFSRQGTLYAGRQPGTRIQRIASGGRPVTEFGPPQVDPDVVLVDTAGTISGKRHAVLVGGGGILAAIYPAQTYSVIFNSGCAVVVDLQFERRGRLIFYVDLPRVLVSNGGPPTVLFTTPSRPGSIAIDEDNRIFVALADGTIRVYTPDGALADSAFATGLAGLDTYLAFGRGAGGFGRFLYVLSGSTLLRFNMNGNRMLIGTGFHVGPSSGTGFTFGPDQALYVSDYQANRVLRISRRNVR